MSEPTGVGFVPLWGAVTSLALQNSPPVGPRLRELPLFLRGWAEIKIAAAMTNREMGVLDSQRADAIVEAAEEVVRGELLDHFPLRVLPTGGGTATNMNVNEVIASRATQILSRTCDLKVHPNDHVNRSQSTNDTYPTAAKLLLMRQSGEICAALRMLGRSFRRQADANAGIDRLGRTGWQDAVSVPVSSFHGAQGVAAERFADQFEAVAGLLGSVQLGGTVLGTGIGAPPGFAPVAVGHLAAITGLTVKPSVDFADSFTHLDGYAALGDTAARCASILFKQASDFEILSSGPRGGLSELSLERLQPGSSIMPGKVNPAIPRLVIQASFAIRAAAFAVNLAVADGEPDINGHSPVVVANLSPALTELSSVIGLFAEKCVDTLSWNPARLAELNAYPFDTLITEAEHAGYDAIAKNTI
ncbi:aspartate ammonia-lyase (plasmid) [Rhodococcus qingshengii]|uniref:lyase family protein n=1 Tax=Rhodococcus qingshengii TaxID=334542 RepID=UPI0007E56664|nr:lyase family protein [Rhodococcus qingshengii]BCF86320.1 aspartate ammonia-lyase [Rhodococcus qingshengii]